MARLVAKGLMNLLRAVLLLWSMLAFLGWGFSGTTGLVGNAILVTIAASVAVATTPDRALRDPGLRVPYGVIVLAGMVGIAIWTWDALSSSCASDWPGFAFEGVGGLGLLAGLARLRQGAAAEANAAKDEN